MEIQWYPGHMAKTKRLISEHIKQVDIVIEILDARIPYSSNNPLLDQLLSGKPRVPVLNKIDLADPHVSNLWAKWYAEHGNECVFMNSVTGEGIKALLDRIHILTEEKAKSSIKRGIKNFRVKSMVVGIPNVGKSSFINRVAGRSAARTGATPGVTKGKQWIRLSKDIDLLDTPGILSPKLQDRRVGLNLAYTGAIKDEVLDTEEIAANLLLYLAENYPENLKKRYKLANFPVEGFRLLEEVGRNRGCLMSGGVVDTLRASTMVLDELRSGTLGRISLESPGDSHIKNISSTDGG